MTRFTEKTLHYRFLTYTRYRLRGGLMSLCNLVIAFASLRDHNAVKTLFVNVKQVVIFIAMYIIDIVIGTHDRD